MPLYAKENPSVGFSNMNRSVFCLYTPVKDKNLILWKKKHLLFSSFIPCDVTKGNRLSSSALTPPPARRRRLGFFSPSHRNIRKVPANHQPQRLASNSKLEKHLLTLVREKPGLTFSISCNDLFLSLEATKYYTHGLDTPHAVLCQVKKKTKPKKNVLKFMFPK